MRSVVSREIVRDVSSGFDSPERVGGGDCGVVVEIRSASERDGRFGRFIFHDHESEASVRVVSEDSGSGVACKSTGWSADVDFEAIGPVILVSVALGVICFPTSFAAVFAPKEADDGRTLKLTDRFDRGRASCNPISSARFATLGASDFVKLTEPDLLPSPQIPPNRGDLTESLSADGERFAVSSVFDST